MADKVEHRRAITKDGKLSTKGTNLKQAGCNCGATVLVKKKLTGRVRCPECRCTVNVKR